MSEYVLQTVNLSKKYGKRKVVNRVHMEIEKGAIYGFIGLNGAGKTTFLRLITGLTHPDEGMIELLGQHHPSALMNMRKRIGALIEEPALFEHMTAEQNLEVVRLQRGIPGKDCIQQALKKVGLQEAKKKKVQDFSLGMKQRLGIAIALLSEPEFLILDEPINGLDPLGVVEIRRLLKKMNEDYGVTILLSSHILSEIYQMATKFGIIHRGKLIQQFTAEELDEKSKAHLFIEVDQPKKAVVVLEEQFKEADFTVLPDGKIKLFRPLDEGQRIPQLFAENGIQLIQFTPQKDTLEDYFTQLIQTEEEAYV